MTEFSAKTMTIKKPHIRIKILDVSDKTEKF